MRKALIMLPVLLLGGCHMAFGHDSGPRETRAFQVGGFEKIALAGSPDVTVQVGGAPSVRAEGSKETLDRLEIKVENGVLRIGRRSNSGWSFGWHHDGRVRIIVTTPALAGAQIAGSGDIRIDKVAGASFDGSIAGSGDLAVDHMEVGEAHFSIAGSGDVSAAGKAGKASFQTAGSGDIRAGALETGTASISIMGSGSTQARATQSADISIMGSGDVHVAGTTNCNVHKAGSGDARCG
jgi:hypothetical protein